MKSSCNRDRSARLRRAAVRRFTIVLACIGLISATPGVFLTAASAATPTPPFTQCPAVGWNTSCTLLVNVTNTGVQILQDTHATTVRRSGPGRL